MYQLSIKGILEMLDKLNKSDLLKHMTNGSKNKKLNFVAFWSYGLGPLQWGRRYAIETTFLSSLYSFDSIFFTDSLDW